MGGGHPALRIGRMADLIQEIPEGERPRERLRDRGGGALLDAELVAILLRVGVRRWSLATANLGTGGGSGGGANGGGGGG